jgi:ribosomal protein L37E
MPEKWSEYNRSSFDEQPMIKLNLKQNAFHTLRHAIQQMADASREDDLAYGRKWDERFQTVDYTENGRVYYQPVGPLARRPARYNLKFALLHLIQSCELFLKAYLVETQGSASILDAKNGQRTITLYEALKRASKSIQGLLTLGEVELLFSANALRNQIQHFEFEYRTDALRQLCVDFLVICRLLAQKLFGVNVVEELTYDPCRNEADPLGDFLSTMASELSIDSRPTADRIAADWSERNPTEHTMLCIACGSRCFRPATGVCGACGAEGDERASRLAEELDELDQRIITLRESGQADR